VSKLTGNIIPKPAYVANQPWKQIRAFFFFVRQKSASKDLQWPTEGPKDTRPDIVLLKTFNEDTLNPLKKAAYQHKEVTNSAAAAADNVAEAAKK